jgi:hypothetical protein
VPGLTNEPPHLAKRRLNLLILRTLRSGPMHGYGIAQQIRVQSDHILKMGEGSIYPALQGLLLTGSVKAEWRASENNRRARYYTLTPVTPEVDVRVAAGAAAGVLTWGGYGQEWLAAQNREARLLRKEAISAGAGQNLTERPTLVIHVDDRTHLIARDREAAEQEVVRIYAAAGVHAVWRDGFALADQTRTDLFPYVSVRILDSWATERMTAGERRGSKIVGRAARATGRAYVFYPRLESAARFRDRHVGMVVGAAMAHEVGHLLLPKNSHSNVGIMREDLDLKSHRPLGFTPAQSAAIRKALRMWPNRAR